MNTVEIPQSHSPCKHMPTGNQCFEFQILRGLESPVLETVEDVDLQNKEIYL